MMVNIVRGNPYRFAEAFARGEMARDDLITASTSWRYTPGHTRTEGLHDDLLNYVEGSFDDVEAALDDELIDNDIYELAYTAHHDQAVAARRVAEAQGDDG